MLAAMLVTLLAAVGSRASMLDDARGHAICGAYGYHIVEAKFRKETHLLCLKLMDIGSSPLTVDRAALLLDPEASEEHSAMKPISLENITMAYGYPLENPLSGSAEGYIGEDHHFYGVLHLDGRTLHADPYGRDDPTRMFGAFEDDFVSAPQRPRRDDAQAMRDDLQVALPRFLKGKREGIGLYGPFATDVQSAAPFSIQHSMDMPMGMPFPFRIEERPHVPGVARARVCDLLLMADKEFFIKDANSSLNHVVRRMVHAVAQADIIFRNADFNEDGVPDNIGFSVKYILVLTSNETNNRVFGDLLNEKTIDGRQYLMRFARLRRLSEVCLGVAFSGHAFHNRTLGLSFTSLGGGMGGAAGGLCDRRAYGRSFNTLALAHATSEDNDRVPERIAALTLAHEMGHSFGAHHDDNFPNPECRGYLMGSQSSVVQSSQHFEFSLCSKRLIASTLNSMSYCLTEEDRAYCGNGIVEQGEACDCGMPSRCSQLDPCCTPRAGGVLVFEEGTLHKDGCAVSPSAMCHPSQGLCCSGNCKYADLSRHGIDCEMMGQECTSVNCTGECSCGLGGRCHPDGSCHAAECVSLGLRECQCQKKGPGGKLSEKRMCGTCCQVENECVGAEIAALRYYTEKEHLPDNWPHYNYAGPNVTVQFCNEDHCAYAQLRAWPVGEPCITRNEVGFCSISGICKPRISGPSSNVYPDARMKLMGQTRASAASTPFVYPYMLLQVIYTFLVK